MTRVSSLLIGGAAALFLALPAAAQQPALQQQPSLQQPPAGQGQQQACAQDVVQHCPTAAGKPDDLKKCLLTSQSKLSSACQRTVQTSGG